MNRTTVTRALFASVLAVVLGVFAFQAASTNQVGAVPAMSDEPQVVAQADATGEELAVDMNEWRETYFIPGAASKSRPRRGRR